MEATIIKMLKKGGIGVMPTDTIYGLVSSALLLEAVNKIYSVRYRRPEKPMIKIVYGRIILCYNLK